MYKWLRSNKASMSVCISLVRIKALLGTRGMRKNVVYEQMQCCEHSTCMCNNCACNHPRITTKLLSCRWQCRKTQMQKMIEIAVPSIRWRQNEETYFFSLIWLKVESSSLVAIEWSCYQLFLHCTERFEHRPVSHAVSTPLEEDRVFW